MLGIVHPRRCIARYASLLPLGGVYLPVYHATYTPWVHPPTTVQHGYVISVLRVTVRGALGSRWEKPVGGEGKRASHP